MADTPKTGLSRSNRAEREPSQQEMQRRRQMQGLMEGLEDPEKAGVMGRRTMGIEESMQRQRDAEEQNRLNAVRAGVGREFPDMDPRALMGMSMEEIDQMRQRRERERMMQISQAIERGTRMLQMDPNNIQLRRDLQTLQRQQQELPSQGMNQTLQSAMPVGPNTVIR